MADAPRRSLDEVMAEIKAEKRRMNHAAADSLCAAIAAHANACGSMLDEFQNLAATAEAPALLELVDQCRRSLSRMTDVFTRVADQIRNEV